MSVRVVISDHSVDQVWFKEVIKVIVQLTVFVRDLQGSPREHMSIPLMINHFIQGTLLYTIVDFEWSADFDH